MNPKSFSFHRLDVYQAARELVVLTNRVAKRIPRSERSILEQMRRASLSTKLNIAEGAIRRTSRDKAHRYQIAQAECGECYAILETLEDLELASRENLTEAIELCNRIAAMLQKLIARFRQDPP